MKYLKCLCILLLLAGCSYNGKSTEHSLRDDVKTDSLNNNISDLTNTTKEVDGVKDLKHHPQTDKAFVCHTIKDKNKCFIVISKLHTSLSVYEKDDDDTFLVARYPVCLSLRKGNKERRGDMKTPESPKNAPFRITNIQDASGWHHDFGDGRGSILAYGHWFLRLETPGFSGIGIHGSTNNESSVPGRASEGCIRLRDSDIIHLKEHYAYVGMNVIIMPENADWMSFENKAFGMIENIDYLSSSSNRKSSNTEPEKHSYSDENVDDEILDVLNEIIQNAGKVIVTGENVKLRLSPNIEDGNQYRDENGNPYYPMNGDYMTFTGETKDFYRVLYNGKEVYISKKYAKKIE